MSRHYAVFGHPVAHSLSPRIQAAFARQAGIAMDYVAIDTTDFDAALRDFTAGGGAGANVTLPYKQQAAAACAVLSPRARRAGAVNTLIRNGDAWHGDNTDGVGLVRDLAERHGIDLRSRRTLLLGAGGAARGVAWNLLDAGVDTLTIVNRSPNAADELADAIGVPARAHTRYWEDLADIGSYDLIVNATSAGVLGAALQLPFSLIGARALCYDLSYGAAAGSFLAWAQAAGARYAFDGLGMLLETAADAFELWHGQRPDTESVYQLLRRQTA